MKLPKEPFKPAQCSDEHHAKDQRNKVDRETDNILILRKSYGSETNTCIYLKEADIIQRAKSCSPKPPFFTTGMTDLKPSELDLLSTVLQFLECWAGSWLKHTEKCIFSK